MLRLLLSILCAALFVSSPAKDLPEQSKTYTVYVNYETYSVRADVLRDAGKIHPKTGHFYYWYANNDIKRTDGGFDGKLLHGEYKSFYRNMNLREQGKFCSGLKEGKWITWYENGHVQERAEYRDGLLHGLDELYNENGQLISSTHYRNGSKEGRSVSYKGNVVDTIVIYKNDHPQPAKVKKKPEKKSSAKSKQDKPGEVNAEKKSADKKQFRLKQLLHKKKNSSVEEQKHPDQPEQTTKKKSTRTKTPKKSSGS